MPWLTWMSHSARVMLGSHTNSPASPGAGWEEQNAAGDSETVLVALDVRLLCTDDFAFPSSWRAKELYVGDVPLL